MKAGPEGIGERGGGKITIPYEITRPELHITTYRS